EATGLLKTRRPRRRAPAASRDARPLARGAARAGTGRGTSRHFPQLDFRRLPRDPGVYLFRDDRGRPLYVGKSISIRTRARAHFCAPAEWTDRAETVDYRPTNSELGALVLENQLIKQWRPPGNRQLKRTDGYVYIRARLDIPFPVLEVAGEPAPGLAINVGPLRGRDAA